MIERIIEISSGPTQLSISHQQLVISCENKEKKTVPVEDISLLLLNHPAITMSQAVVVNLAESKAAIVYCAANQMPASISLPFSGNTLQGERLRQQIKISQPLRKRIWQSIVCCKIGRQADALEQVMGTHLRLRRMIKHVRSGDPDNIEAQAAQYYWPRLFDTSFKRERLGLFPNNLLNYGYMILRSAIARNICMSGLNPGIGLFHHNRANSFPLADDLIEVWRPLIDICVKKIYDSQNSETIKETPLMRTHKEIILSVLNKNVSVGKEFVPVKIAMRRMVASLARTFEEEKLMLVLPDKYLD